MSVGMRGGEEGDILLPRAHGRAGGSAVGNAVGRVLVREVRSIDTARVKAVVARHSRLALALKRGLDIGVAALGLIVAAPLLILLGILIRLDSSGPALYRQPRIGRGERPFTITKLRTMDSEGRVTRVGRLLRPMGLDELPQLWNVLKGDMSIIGPRPELLHLVARFEKEFPGHDARHLMRPGITGWAQVNGLRGTVPIAERLFFDVDYLRSWSLMLDWQILLRTLGTVWRDTRRALRS